jgi:hypothetical protein
MSTDKAKLDALFEELKGILHSPHTTPEAKEEAEATNLARAIEDGFPGKLLGTLGDPKLTLHFGTKGVHCCLYSDDSKIEYSGLRILVANATREYQLLMSAIGEFRDAAAKKDGPPPEAMLWCMHFFKEGFKTLEDSEKATTPTDRDNSIN